MTEIASQIPGVEWGRVRAHADGRGALRELWRASKSTGRFVQANLSLSNPGVLRGLHFHERQRDFWVVAEGEVFVAVVDLRKSASGRTPRPVTRLLTTDDTVVIPEMVAHGFLAIRATKLLYLVTNEYDGSDEHGLAWDDPEIAVPWPAVATPDGRPVLSDRDRANLPYRAIKLTTQGSRMA